MFRLCYGRFKFYLDTIWVFERKKSSQAIFLYGFDIEFLSQLKIISEYVFFLKAIIERQDRVNFPTIYNKFNADDVCQAIDILQAIAINLREKREKQGALRLDLPRLSFKMDWETRTPTGFRVYDRKDSHKLVEEFMLLANMRVAMKIYENFPQISVLRNHPPPDATKRNFLSKELEALGIHMDLSSSASIQQGMLQYAQASSDPVSVGRNLVISNLIAKPMKVSIFYWL